MSQTCVGTWHIRPTPAKYEGRSDLSKTWTGPINGEMYGKGLKDLCNRTEENLAKLSFQMQKMDPCIEYGIKHWHSNSRPKTAHPEPVEKLKTPGTWESVEVMFTDNKVLDSLGSHIDKQADTYMDPPARTSFCYLCSTLEEHRRHMLQHRPKRRPKSAKPRIEYIAPRPKQKRKQEEEEIRVRERLYKVEVFTSDKTNAGTNANVFITMKGSLEILPRTQLKKNRGCAQLCFVRASKEVFHVKGPFLGNLQILTIEHDGKQRSQAWHLDHVHVTDVKAMKTWVFHCREWLSIYEKPYYSNILDLQAQEKESPVTDFTIEVYTGKQKMAGTDSNIYISLMGHYGSSKKIHLVDPSSDKKLFEKGSVDKFRIHIPGVGELKRIRIEHDGKGFAAGWFLEKVIILDSERPKDKFHFIYGGWIARDEGDGRLWREIKAKKHLSQEIKSGTDTKYQISVKTGDKRYAGTDANVFIQLAGVKGITKKLKLDDAKNNFERNMVDNFEVRAVNVGAMKHIAIGHDNFGPGAGWYLESVTVRRYVPKDEAKERRHKIKKRLKHEKKHQKDKKHDSDVETESETDDEKDNRRLKKKPKDKKKEKEKDLKKQKKSTESTRKRRKDLFSVSSSSESSSESSDEGSDLERGSRYSRRPGSEKRRPRSALRKDRDIDKDDSSGTESSFKGRPGSALRRDRKFEKDDSSETESSVKRRPGSALRRDSRTGSDRRRKQSVSSDKSDRDSSAAGYRMSRRRVSTSASSLKRQNERKGKGESDYEDDDNLDEIKVPLYEECFFECNQWLAADEGDGLFVRELTVTKKTTFFKENPMQ